MTKKTPPYVCPETGDLIVEAQGDAIVSVPAKHLPRALANLDRGVPPQSCSPYAPFTREMAAALLRDRALTWFRG